MCVIFVFSMWNVFDMVLCFSLLRRMVSSLIWSVLYTHVYNLLSDHNVVLEGLKGTRKTFSIIK